MIKHLIRGNVWVSIWVLLNDGQYALKYISGIILSAGPLGLITRIRCRLVVRWGNTVKIRYSFSVYTWFSPKPVIFSVCGSILALQRTPPQHIESFNVILPPKSELIRVSNCFCRIVESNVSLPRMLNVCASPHARVLMNYVLLFVYTLALLQVLLIWGLFLNTKNHDGMKHSTL